MEKQAEVITSDVAEYKDSSQSRCYNKKKWRRCALPLCVFLDMPCVSGGSRSEDEGY